MTGEWGYSAAVFTLFSWLATLWVATTVFEWVGVTGWFYADGPKDITLLLYIIVFVAWAGYWLRAWRPRAAYAGETASKADGGQR